MKFSLIIIYTFLSLLFKNSLYDIDIEKLKGGKQSMSDFKGKKILVAVIRAASPDKAFLKSLDSIQIVNRDSLVVIAVPVPDVDSVGKEKDVRSDSTIGTKDFKIDSLHLNILITKPLSAKKKSSKQHPLFKWLTRAEDNSHFSSDVKENKQLFFISKKGVLYAKLDWEVAPEIIINVINQDFIE